jgi:DNA polymerase-3 subunit beta
MLSFVSEARSLSDAVSLVAKAATDKDVLPALTGIRIETETRTLRLSASDLETGIDVHIAADVQAEGAVLLPARRLQELLRRVPPEDVVEVHAIDGTASLRFGRSRFDLVTLPLDDYPEISFADPAQVTAKLPLAGLRHALQRVAYAVSQREEALPGLMGIRLRVRQTDADLTASDNFRLAWCRVEDVQGPEEPLDLIVQGRTLVELCRLVDTEEVGVVAEPRRVHLLLDGVRAFAQRIEGRFPDHEALLRKAFVTRMEFHVPALLAACERAQLVSDMHNPQVVLNVSPGEPVRIQAGAADLGQAQEEVPATVEGEKLEVGFNPRYLIDALRNLGAPEAVLSFSGPLSAAKLTPKEGEAGQLAILLPLRLW